MASTFAVGFAATALRPRVARTRASASGAGAKPVTRGIAIGNAVLTRHPPGTGTDTGTDTGTGTDTRTAKDRIHGSEAKDREERWAPPPRILP